VKGEVNAGMPLCSMYCNPYCNPSADGLPEAAHDALSGSHLRLASIAWSVGGIHRDHRFFGSGVRGISIPFAHNRLKSGLGIILTDRLKAEPSTKTSCRVDSALEDSHHVCSL
jgi:hypothetical protein